LEFCLTSGNAGTGMCQRGASEHGCEFAPVARKKIKFKSKFLVPLTVFMQHSHPANAVDIQTLPSKDYHQSLSHSPFESFYQEL